MSLPVPQYQVGKSLSLTTAFGLVHTVATNRWLTIKNVHISNFSAGPVAVQVCFVPSGASPVSGNSALWNFSVPANDFIEWGDGQRLPPGASVQALASAGTAINLWISGIEESLPSA
jgi:hypothetical protein